MSGKTMAVVIVERSVEDVARAQRAYPAMPVNDSTEALRPQGAPEQIADRILTAIAIGILYPGDKLPPERELTVLLGVSRTTLRQAISRLAALGVLEARRGRHGGTFVRTVEPRSIESDAIVRDLGPIWEQLEETLDYRNLVQQMIARTAAQRRTPEDCAKIAAALAQYGRSTSAAESRNADRALHDAIAAATQNLHLAQLNGHLAMATNLGFSTHPYSTVLHDRALQQHAALVEAIVQGDAEEAGRLAEEHFVTTGTLPLRAAFSAGQDAANAESAPNA